MKFKIGNLIVDFQTITTETIDEVDVEQITVNQWFDASSKKIFTRLTFTVDRAEFLANIETLSSREQIYFPQELVDQLNGRPAPHKLIYEENISLDSEQVTIKLCGHEA
jgi:hypothetical protein